MEKLDKSLPKADEQGISLIESFGKGLDEGIKFAQDWLKANLSVDPEVLRFIHTPLGPLPPGVAPGVTPAVEVAIATSPLYTFPYNGNQLPVYDVTVTNKGPNTETFRLTSYNNTGQFNIVPGYGFLTLSPGQVGQVNFCSAPYDSTGVSVPPVGSTHPITITATGLTSGVIGTGDTTYVMPPLPSLSLNISPQVLSVTPGGNVSATLTIGSTGNVAPGSVELTADPDPGLTLDGLTSPVNVPLNGVVTQPVTISAAPGAVLGTSYVPLTASYTGPGGLQSVLFSIPVTVAKLGTCSLSTAQSAKTAGKISLANSLGHLSADMNAAAEAPGNAAFVSRIAGDLQLVNNNLDVPYLQVFTANIAAAGLAVAQATPGTLLTALTNLDATICPVGAALQLSGNYSGQVSFTPSSAITGPNLPATFTIRLTNFTNSLKVYDLSVTGVPAGVTSQFTSTSISLGAPSVAPPTTTSPRRLR